jgi:SAM-dependent methyltransferase
MVPLDLAAAAAGHHEHDEDPAVTTPTRAERQAAEYAFPYHHLPHFTGAGGARLGRAMRGGMEYLAYAGIVADVVRSLDPRSVLDVGCGDGRLLGELVGTAEELRGVDLDHRAVAYAQALVPDAHLTAEPVEALVEEFDVVTCVETLEHVPAAAAAGFLAATAARVRAGGHLVVCVPSDVRALTAKHFRHYDRGTLASALDGLPGEWDLLRLEEVVRHRPLREAALRLVANRWWTLDVPRWNGRVLRDQRRAVGSARGLHVLAVLERRT